MFTVANCETFYMDNRSTYTTKQNIYKAQCTTRGRVNLNRLSNLIIYESQELSQYALGDLFSGSFWNLNRIVQNDCLRA